jgi:hypothetical protein
MASIPLPLPSVGPSGQALPGIGVKAVGDAFGTGVAEADQKLGRQMEASSDEIFTRAVSLQNQYNDAEAKEADAKYIIQSSDLHEKFLATKGQDAVNAKPKFLADLEKVRSDIRGSLSNPAAQKIYDSTTRQNFARTVFAASTHAGREARDYIKQSQTTQIAADAELSHAFPDNEGYYQDGLSKTRANVKALAKSQGIPEGSVIEKKMLKDAESGLLAQRLIGMAKKDPIKAFDMYSETAPDSLNSEDRRKVQAIVVYGRRSAIGKIVSDEVNFGASEEEKPLQQRLDEAEKKIQKYEKDDPLLKVEVRNRVITDFNQTSKIKRDGIQRDASTVFQAINALGLEGNPPTKLEQILTTPEVQAAWERSLVENPNLAKNVRNQLKLNASNNVRETTQSEWQRLNAQSEEDVNAFLAEDPYANDKLSYSDQRKIAALQAQKRKAPDKNPQVQEAMKILAPTLESFHITRDRKDIYLQYQGALMDAMADYQKEHKKRMPFDEIQKTGTRLLQEVSAPNTDRIGFGGVLFPPKEKLYNVQVPEKARLTIMQMYQEKTGAIPDDKMIQRDYVRMQYNQKYGAKPKPKDQGQVGKPTVQPPVSQ